MMQAHECLANAERCEQMARATSDADDVRMLLETADLWRRLARSSVPPTGVYWGAKEPPGE